MINNLFNSMIQMIPNIQGSKAGHHSMPREKNTTGLSGTSPQRVITNKSLSTALEDTKCAATDSKSGHVSSVIARQALENKILLNMIKKENKINIYDTINAKRIDESDTESDEIDYFNLLDNMDLDNMDEDKLHNLNTNLVSVKNSLINGINEIND